MRITDVFAEELVFDEDDECLVLKEGSFPLSPFIAFAAFKKGIFNKLKRTKGFKTAKKVSKLPTKAKAKALTAVEKTKASIGATAGKGKEATVYKLTSEQMGVMADVYSKYGKQLVNEILKFRKNVLAPYQLIKRTIKKSARVSSKDITGMNREEYESALESGRKKIEARGEKFFGKSKELQGKLAEAGERIENLEKLKKDFMAGKKPEYSIANKVYRSFDVGEEEFGGYTKDELRRTYDSLMSTRRLIKDELRRLRSKKSLTPEDFAKAQELMKKSKQLESGKAIDLTKEEQFRKAGGFNAALGKYFFSREIWRDLTSPRQINVFKKTYLSIIDKMIGKAREYKGKDFAKLVKGKKTVEFTGKEKLIWAKRPSIKVFSGDIKDYYLKITPEQFLEKPISMKRSPKLRKAEQQIENEVKRFERKLGKIITAEDLGRLKKYRLINNLITLRELESPKKLFKTREDLQKETRRSKDEDYLSQDEFTRRIREIATIEYDTMAELRNAKIQASAMARQMRDQGDESVVEKYANILKQIKFRRDTSPQKVVGQEVEPTGIIDIDDIQKLATRILKTEYEDVDQPKHDNTRLDKLIKQYKEDDPEDAERNLEEIDFLLKRVERKLNVAIKK